MQTIQDFAGSTDMWSSSVGGHLMKVVNLTGFTVLWFSSLSTISPLSHCVMWRSQSVCVHHMTHDKNRRCTQRQKYG